MNPQRRRPAPPTNLRQTLFQTAETVPPHVDRDTLHTALEDLVARFEMNGIFDPSASSFIIMLLDEYRPVEG